MKRKTLTLSTEGRKWGEDWLKCSGQKPLHGCRKGTWLRHRSTCRTDWLTNHRDSQTTSVTTNTGKERSVAYSGWDRSQMGLTAHSRRDTCLQTAHVCYVKHRQRRHINTFWMTVRGTTLPEESSDSRQQSSHCCSNSLSMRLSEAAVDSSMLSGNW